MPNRLAVIKTLQQDVLGNHRWDERTRSYATVPVEDVWAVEDAMAAVLERVARAVNWPRLILEATQRHEVRPPRPGTGRPSSACAGNAWSRRC